MDREKRKLLKRKKNEIKERLKMLKRLLRVDKDYRRIKALTLEDKADTELDRRIVLGLTEKQKDDFTPLYPKVRKLLVNYFTENKDAVRCPITEWSWALKELGVVPQGFHMLIARADNSLYRWKHREGEWEGFNRVNVINEYKMLKEKLNAVLKSLELEEKGPEEFKGDYLKIFDGSL